MNWYLAVLRKYAVFSGRARREEYWMFFLINLIIVVVLAGIEGFLSGILGESAGRAAGNDQSVMALIYRLVVLVPSLAVGVRRMHDTDHSGWWIIVPIVNLVYACRAGTPSENRFGPDPKVRPPPLPAPTPTGQNAAAVAEIIPGAENGTRGNTASEVITDAREQAGNQACALQPPDTVQLHLTSKMEELDTLRRELAPLKKRRKHVMLLFMIGGAITTGIPTLVVFPPACVCATLVGLGLGFLAARLLFLMNPTHRAISAQLASEETLIEQIATLRQKGEQGRGT